MDSVMVTISPERDKTRVLMASREQDIMKAVLPPASEAHPQAASFLLDALALWHQQRLPVVLLVDDPESSSGELCLRDALGFGARTLHYDVTVASRAARQGARRRSIPGVGNFRDLRQLSFAFEVLR